MKMSPSIQPVNNTVCHLVVSVSADKEKLLMVQWSRKAMCVMVDDQRRAMNLQVFEAGLAEGQWLEVKDLGGQVLFLRELLQGIWIAGAMPPEIPTREPCVHLGRRLAPEEDRRRCQPV